MDGFPTFVSSSGLLCFAITVNVILSIAHEGVQKVELTHVCTHTFKLYISSIHV